MKSKTIAIIDEDKEISQELADILSLGGYTPVQVVDPLLAIRTIFRNKPDIILMELRMPSKCGFELTHAINTVFERSKIPIIAMSESYKDEFRWLLNFCGIKRWIKKPLRPLDLIWAIESEIEQDNQLEKKNTFAQAKAVV